MVSETPAFHFNSCENFQNVCAYKKKEKFCAHKRLTQYNGFLLLGMRESYRVGVNKLAAVQQLLHRHAYHSTDPEPDH